MYLQFCSNGMTAKQVKSYLVTIVEFKSSLITSICSLGSAVGAFGIGPFVSKLGITLQTKFGKKNCLLLANLLVIVGAGVTLIRNEIAITVGRFVYGMASGSFSVLVPGFSNWYCFIFLVNELAPVELKGPLGAITQILITVGI